MNDYSDSHGLRADCLCFFSKYVSEANRTCRLLLEVEKFPVSQEEQQAILGQRLLEIAAFQDYLSARAKLLEACRDGLPSAPKFNSSTSPGSIPALIETGPADSSRIA